MSARQPVKRGLENLHAMRGRGMVKMYGEAGWLKGRPVVLTYLTVREARRLAIELLTAAEYAEDAEDCLVEQAAR